MRDLDLKDSKDMVKSLDRTFEQLYRLGEKVGEGVINHMENPYTKENQEWWAANFKSCLEGGFDELKKVVGILQKHGLLKDYEPPKELTEKIANIDKEAQANVDVGRFISYIKDEKGYGERPDSPVDWEGVKTHIKIQNALVEFYKSEEARMCTAPLLSSSV